jgi:hypothetical protein
MTLIHRSGDAAQRCRRRKHRGGCPSIGIIVLAEKYALEKRDRSYCYSGDTAKDSVAAGPRRIDRCLAR